jgi:hypothetical protein
MFGPFAPALVNGQFPALGVPDGSAAAPGLYFFAEPTLGFYRPAAGLLDIGIGGVRAFRFATNGVLTGAGNGTLTLGVDNSIAITPGAGSYCQVSQPFRLADGAIATPALTFSADTNTGVYRVGADEMGFVTNGALRILVDNNGLRLFTGSFLQFGFSYTVAAVVQTGYITVKDSTGTNYKMLCGL